MSDPTSATYLTASIQISGLLDLFPDTSDWDPIRFGAAPDELAPMIGVDIYSDVELVLAVPKPRYPDREDPVYLLSAEPPFTLSVERALDITRALEALHSLLLNQPVTALLRIEPLAWDGEVLSIGSKSPHPGMPPFSELTLRDFRTSLDWWFQTWDEARPTVVAALASLRSEPNRDRFELEREFLSAHLALGALYRHLSAKFGWEEFNDDPNYPHIPLPEGLQMMAFRLGVLSLEYLFDGADFYWAIDVDRMRDVLLSGGREPGDLELVSDIRLSIATYSLQAVLKLSLLREAGMWRLIGRDDLQFRRFESDELLDRYRSDEPIREIVPGAREELELGSMKRSRLWQWLEEHVRPYASVWCSLLPRR